jgi:hypothetical protein
MRCTIQYFDDSKSTSTDPSGLNKAAKQSPSGNALHLSPAAVVTAGVEWDLYTYLIQCTISALHNLHPYPERIWGAKEKKKEQYHTRAKENAKLL